MSRPTPTTDLEWRRNMAKDVRGIQRRGAGRDLLQSGSVRRARLPDLYRGPGPTPVILEGYAEETAEAYEWLVPYQPKASREVDLIRVGGTYVIMGQSGDSHRGGWDRVDLLANWGTYNDGLTATPTSQWREPFMATRLSSGIVVLGGLLAGGTLTAGTVIAVLPEGMRPDYELVFPLEANDVRRGVGIFPNGEVKIRGGWTGSYASLDGIAFPAAGVADWTFIDPQGTAGSANAFLNGWVDHGGVGGGTFGRARYWVDEYGTIWYGGLVSGGTIVDNNGIFTMPAALRPTLEEHMVAASGDTFGAVGIRPASGINIKGNSSSSWTSLAGVTSHTPASYVDPSWKAPPHQGGWVRHTTSFPVPAVRRRGDGLCQSRGLIASGTLGTRVFQLPLELRTDRQIILAAYSNSARGRLDIYGDNRELASYPGSFIPAQGSNVWFSLDNLKWYPG